MDALPIHRLAVLGVIESYEGLIHNSKRRCRRAAENCFFFLCVCALVQKNRYDTGKYTGQSCTFINVKCMLCVFIVHIVEPKPE